MPRPGKVRSEIKLKLTKSDRERLYRVSGAHPLTLTTEKETRELLRDLVEQGVYTIQPEAKAAIENALAEVASLACPLMPVTDFERVAYADEEDVLECVATVANGYHFTAGRKYPISTGSYKFNQKFSRTKIHFNEKNLSTYPVDHHCLLSGTDRYIEVRDDELHIAN